MTNYIMSGKTRTTIIVLLLLGIFFMGFSISSIFNLIENNNNLQQDYDECMASYNVSYDLPNNLEINDISVPDRVKESSETDDVVTIPDET